MHNVTSTAPVLAHNASASTVARVIAGVTRALHIGAAAKPVLAPRKLRTRLSRNGQEDIVYMQEHAW